MPIRNGKNVSDSSRESSVVGRRAVVKSAAWATPVVAVAVASPLAAASTEIASIWGMMTDVAVSSSTWDVQFTLSPAEAITPEKEMFSFYFPSEGGDIEAFSLDSHSDLGGGVYRVTFTLPFGWGFEEGVNTVTMTFGGKTATGPMESIG